MDLEKELTGALQDAVDCYLDGRDAIDEGEFGKFIKEKLGKFALEYASENSEDILNKLFSEEAVKKSRISPNNIAKAYEIGDNLKDLVETSIDVYGLYIAATEYKAAGYDPNIRNVALGKMTLT